MTTRFVELDLLRGLAVVLMIMYHFVFDWVFFVQPIFDLTQGFWLYWGRLTAVLFVGLAGGALILRAHRASTHGLDWRARAWKHGLFILGCGGLVTLVTYVLFPAYTIWFGVLHLVGVSILLGTFFVERPTLTFWAGIIFTLGGVLLSTIFYSSLPFWPPFFPVYLQTFDYFPLFPWLGVFLLGMNAGNYFYPRGKTHSLWGERKISTWQRGLAWLGKNSLAIYLLHQPLLISMLWMMGKISF